MVISRWLLQDHLTEQYFDYNIAVSLIGGPRKSSSPKKKHIPQYGLQTNLLQTLLLFEFFYKLQNRANNRVNNISRAEFKSTFHLGCTILKVRFLIYTFRVNLPISRRKHLKQIHFVIDFLVFFPFFFFCLCFNNFSGKNAFSKQYKVVR